MVVRPGKKNVRTTHLPRFYDSLQRLVKGDNYPAVMAVLKNKYVKRGPDNETLHGPPDFEAHRRCWGEIPEQNMRVVCHVLGVCREDASKERATEARQSKSKMISSLLRF